MAPPWFLAAVLYGASTVATNFPFEATKLTDVEVLASPYLAFGNVSAVPAEYSGPSCKVSPGDASWPSIAEWAAFNKSLEGRLLKPTPPAAVCYASHSAFDKAECDFLVNRAKDTRFYLSDPVTIMTSWAQGLTCVAASNAVGNCTQGGFPEYVVNASSVRDVQLAVNFARNKHLRLNIKNTGHDFVGRSAGYASLSVWVHYLKGIDPISEYTIGQYKGPAVRLGTGTESFEVANWMVDQQNITVVVSGFWSLGAAGGWSMGGGHGSITSFLGLGADQVLSLNVVTADGSFLTADPTQNEDLFFALRGGGGGTYGIVTSAIFKAYPTWVTLSGASISLAVGPVQPKTIPQTASSPFAANTTATAPSLAAFWAAYAHYLAFSAAASDAGGLGFCDVTPLGNDSYTLAASFSLANMTAPQAAAFLRPFFAGLRALGADLGAADPAPQSVPYPRRRTGADDAPRSDVFASRFVPRANLEEQDKRDATVRAVRAAAELGLSVRSRNFSPSLKVAGWPGSTAAVSRAFRASMMHLTVFEPAGVEAGVGGVEFAARHGVLAKGMEGIRTVTPGSGAYFNEADRLEPEWQVSFFGEHYGRLLRVKERVDPWGLFWAPNTVGSEGWEVKTVDGLPSQNGRLCRV